MFDPERIASIGIQAIAGDLPAGGSVRYDEDYLRLESEVGKLDNPAGGEVDWNLVSSTASTLLVTKSKDLLVLAWLVRALWQSDGWTGLAAGLRACRDMLANFWDGIQPPRPRARRSALEWCGERVAVVLDPDRPDLFDEARIDESLGLVDEIFALTADRFDGEDCGLSALRRRLRELKERIGSGESGADAGAASPDPGAASAERSVVTGGTAGVVAGGPVARPSGPIATRAQAIARLNELADWFTRTEPHSPIGLLVRRAVAWSNMSFEQVFGELLKDKADAQAHVWDVLGIKPDQQ